LSCAPFVHSSSAHRRSRLERPMRRHAVPATGDCSIGATRRTLVLNHITLTCMAIRLTFLGSISDTPRTLTYTSAGVPRFSFGVRVDTVRKRHYLIVSYATAARFADLF
jgi:hypothetical protein